MQIYYCLSKSFFVIINKQIMIYLRQRASLYREALCYEGNGLFSLRFPILRIL